MAIYNLENDSLKKVDPTTFQTEGIFERKNLQAALKQQIDIIAPNSLVIAEEFSEWSDSQRRIDLLAVDNDANLVVIELKRNETGEHMDLQAIRYAAMVSTLTFKQAIDIYQKFLKNNGSSDDAEEKLLDFLDWETPQEEDFALNVRIVLVSANFSKELTTSVMWLLDRNIDIKCMRLTPYNYQGKILIDIQQIIPLPEAESYQVKIKEQAEERREGRYSSKDYSQYIFNGETYNKRKLVLAILQFWFKENKPNHISDLFKVFPKELHQSGLLIKFEDAEKISKSKGITRHFLKDDEVFTFPDKSRFAVSNQWGKGNVDNFLEVVRNLGYKIEEIVTKRQSRSGDDIGEIVEDVIITAKDGIKYRIVRRDSNQIQVFIEDEQVIAKEALRKIINEKQFDIPLVGLNTQQMGKKLLDKLREIV